MRWQERVGHGPADVRRVQPEAEALEVPTRPYGGRTGQFEADRWVGIPARWATRWTVT